MINREGEHRKYVLCWFLKESFDLRKNFKGKFNNF